MNFQEPSKSFDRVIHGADVTAVAFTANDEVLITGSRDNKIRLTNVGSGEPIGRLLNAHTDHVYTLAATSTGRFASAGQEGRILVWNATNLFSPGRALLGREERRTSVVMQPNGPWIASSDNSGKLEFRNAISSKRQSNSDAAHQKPLAFPGDGNMLAVSLQQTGRSGTPEDQRISIWRSQGEVWAPTRQIPLRDKHAIRAATFNANSDSVFLLWDDGVLELLPLSGSNGRRQDLGAEVKLAAFKDENLLLVTYKELRYYRLGFQARLLRSSRVAGDVDTAAGLASQDREFVLGGQNLGGIGLTQLVPTVLFFRFPTGVPDFPPLRNHREMAIFR
jgi:WD40 repeat protein